MSQLKYSPITIADITPVKEFEVTVTLPKARYSSEMIVATYRIVHKDGGFQLKDFHSTRDPKFGWAPTLDAMVDTINAYVEERFESRARYVAADEAHAEAMRAWETSVEAWKAEQMERVEMVPIDEIVDHPNSIDAVVVKGEPRDDFAIDEVMDRDGYRGEKFRLHDGSTWHCADKDYNRQVKSGSKVRAIRKFTRPAPVRPERNDFFRRGLGL